MNRTPFLAAFLAGLLAIVWVGAGDAGANPLALSVLALIAAFYLVGGQELRHYRAASASLAAALAALAALADLPAPTGAPADAPSHAPTHATTPPQSDPPADPQPMLDGWLQSIHPALRNPVRLRIEGERISLPGPTLTPYLVGLLVLLGMIGTFLGMVVTLKGTVSALESTTDLQAMRASLAAPVRGLGLAFGTSVAGVCASAMLGLVSALCRRERLQLSQVLDLQIATRLRRYSLGHQRQENFKALQTQAQCMPVLIEGLQTLMSRIDAQNQAGQERLLASQALFQQHTATSYAGLAASVEQSLKQSLAESAPLAAAVIAPTVAATLAGIANQTNLLHQRVAETQQTRLDRLSERLVGTLAGATEQWREALAATQATLSARDEARLAAWSAALNAMAGTLQREWQQAGAASLAQQQAICHTLEGTAQQLSRQAEAHARQTLGEISGLMQVAAEAPRAAAELIGPLRQQLSDSLARDNAALTERGQIMARLSGLLETVQQASAEQCGAVGALVASSQTLLAAAEQRLTHSAETEAARLAAVAAQVTGSAVEVASLGEAFGLGVQQFGAANDRLTVQLQRVETALGKSSARSDEQLAYYVAQAREVIDLSIAAQTQIVEELQQLARRQVAAEAA